MKKEDRSWVVFENLGQKIFGIIHRPLSKSKVPAVIMCHGFGGDKSGRFRYYVRLAEQLAEQGIASLRFDFRGSGDSEGKLSEMTLNGEIEDAQKAIEFLYKDPLIDSSRLGILGRSLGGAIAVKVASQRSDIKSLALWVPLFSSHKWKEKWGLFQAKSLSEIEKTELLYFNGQMPNREFLQQFFSLNLNVDLKKISHTPLFHAHGGKDTVIDSSHMQEYAACRESAKAETEIVIYPNQDHELRNQQELDKLIDDTVEWFKKTL